jgi:hypothetical protein
VFEIAVDAQEDKYIEADGTINIELWILNDNTGLERLIKQKYIA